MGDDQKLISDELTPETWAMISAVHTLLSTERIAEEQELVLSSCAHILAGGPRSYAELLRGVSEAWPGANISEANFDSALEHAGNLGLIAKQETSSGSEWSLTQAGVREAENSAAWYSAAFSRFANEISERVAQDSGTVGIEQVNLWAGLLIKILLMGIGGSGSAHRGEMELGASGDLRPVQIDAESMIRAIRELRASGPVEEFLSGCISAAIDPTDVFGNEIVGYVSTSCILHAIVAGRSRSGARDRLGSMRNQRVLLDTPLLVSFLGSNEGQVALERIIKSSINLGMEVVVPLHVIEELNDVVSRVGEQHVPGLIDSMKQGMHANVYVQMVNEQILALFVAACEEGRYKNWQEFVAKSEALPSDLSKLGVKVREHGNLSRDKVDHCKQALRRALETNQIPNHRSDKVLQRDAESMEMVWRARRNFASASKQYWPGGWIISTDRYMSPAFKGVDVGDSHDLVLSHAQWATLVAEYEGGSEESKLVAAAASYLLQEASVSIAVKYSPNVALELARTLSLGDVSQTDVRVAQFELGDLLESSGRGETHNGQEIAKLISKKRQNRIFHASERHRDVADSELLRSKRANASMRQQLGAVISESSTARAEALELQSQLDISRNARVQDKLLYDRRVTRAVLVSIGLVVGLLLLISSHLLFGIFTLVSVIAFYWLSHEWVTNPAKPYGYLFWSVIPELLPTIDLLSRLISAPGRRHS